MASPFLGRFLTGMGQAAVNTTSAIDQARKDAEQRVYQALAMRKIAAETELDENKLRRIMAVDEYLRSPEARALLSGQTGEPAPAPEQTPAAPIPQTPGVNLPPSIAQGDVELRKTMARPTPGLPTIHPSMSKELFGTMTPFMDDPRMQTMAKFLTKRGEEEELKAKAERTREGTALGVHQFYQKWNDPSKYNVDKMQEDLTQLKANLGEAKDTDTINSIEQLIKDLRAQKASTGGRFDAMKLTQEDMDFWIRKLATSDEYLKTGGAVPEDMRQYLSSRFYGQAMTEIMRKAEKFSGVGLDITGTTEQRKNFMSTVKQRVATATFYSNLEELQSIIDEAVKVAGPVKTINEFANNIKIQFGDDLYVKFKVLQNALATEFATSLGMSGMAAVERERKAEEALDMNQTPQGLMALVDEARRIETNRLVTLASQGGPAGERWLGNLIGQESAADLLEIEKSKLSSTAIKARKSIHKTTAKTGGTTPGGGGWSPDKETRYQELLRKRQQGTLR